MPARNAPSASDRPTACVAQAEASTASSTARENSSADRTEAIAIEQRSQQPAPRGEHEPERDQGNRDGIGNVAQVGAGAAVGQRRLECQEQRKCQVLEQADRDRDAAVGTVVFRLVGQLRDDDRGRGHRHGAADHDRHRRGAPKRRSRSARRAPWSAATCAPPTPSTSPRIATSRGKENSRPRVKTRKTTPKSASRRVVRCRPPARARAAQHHADGQVPEYRRQRQLAHRRDDADRGGQQDQDLQQRIVHRPSAAVNSPVRRSPAPGP